VRLRSHEIDHEGTPGGAHHRIRYFAKILAGGRLGQNSTFLQQQMVVPHSAEGESCEGADRGGGKESQSVIHTLLADLHFRSRKANNRITVITADGRGWTLKSD
jgi:hypothetical protein